MRERCMCGALDCVACRGPSAKYSAWCDDCPYADECKEKTSPGDDECQRKTDTDNAEADAYETRIEARADRLRDGEDY